MARYGIIVDLNRCTGCMTCVISCKQENLTMPGVQWNKVFQLENESFDHITYVRHACMQCDEPPCVDACREKAIYKRPDGIVIIDQMKCNSCRDCLDACPYGVPQINSSQGYFSGKTLPFEKTPASYRVQINGRASKCTLCSHRIDQGGEPACVTACPSEAMIFGDLDDPKSPIRAKLWQSKQLLAEQGTRPKVSYIAPRNVFKPTEERVVDNPKMG
ncbi:MAG: 4Fe-4S dicluster domain-containing protein [Pseudomonadota bacterium]